MLAFPTFVDGTLYDCGVFFFFGLLLVLMHRQIFSAKVTCFSYLSLLYMLITTAMAFAMTEFISTIALAVKHAQPRPSEFGEVITVPVWLWRFAVASPLALVITLVLCLVQTKNHMKQINQGKAVSKHDRAAQIIALPSVYGVLVLCSLSPVLHLTSGGRHPTEVSDFEEWKHFVFSRYDICLFVADLYEAWILYQFGKLVLEQIEASVWKEEVAESLERRRAAAHVMHSHSAVSALSFLGTWLFIVVCLVQAAWSMVAYFPHLGIARSDQKQINTQLVIAGVITSTAAIYNVHVIEAIFAPLLQNFWPLLKFFSVKLLVSLAFIQQGLLQLLQASKIYTPEAQGWLVEHVPGIGTLLNFDDVQLHLFYPALILYECLIAGIIHMWAWDAFEEWYSAGDDAEREREPLLSGSFKKKLDEEPAKKQDEESAMETCAEDSAIVINFEPVEKKAFLSQ